MKTRKQTLLLVLFVCLVWLQGAAQTQKKDSVEFFTRAIAEYNVFEVSASVGYAGTYSPQFQRFTRLIAVASAEQLQDFVLNHPNPVVRLYAFHALKKKDAKQAALIRTYLSNDPAIVKTLQGCIGSEKPVSSLLDMTIF